MKRIIICALAFLLAATIATAKSQQFSEAEYTINVDYNNVVDPGDAVFIKMRFDSSKKKRKAISPKASAEIFADKKSQGGAANFYVLNSKKTYTEMLVGLPLSSWAKEGDYEIKVNYQVNNDAEKKLTLDLTVSPKEFKSGVINLTQNMANISADTSPEKMAQSKKLNDIITSINPDSVYNVKKFILPVTSKRRTSSFAQRIIYKYPSGKESTTLHAGIDFGIPTGTEIVSDADGKVVLAENRISTGWTIVVEHLPGFYSLYYHLNELKVKEGQHVRQGELIGLSGSTGFSTGPHLHWELRLNSVIVNPDFFLTDYAF